MVWFYAVRIGHYVIDWQALKKIIFHRYGSDIIISTRPGCSYTVISLKYRAEQVLHDLWYTQRKSDDRDEKIRIIRTAAEFILEDASLKVRET